MKKNVFKFKRCITAMLAVCLTIMMLCGNILLYAYADDEEYPIGGGVPIYYPVTSCQSYASNSEHSFIYLCTDTLTYVPSWGQERHNVATWFFYVKPDVEYTYENGVFTISRDYLQLYFYSFQYHYDMEAGHIISDQGPSFLWSEDFSGNLSFKDDFSQFSIGDSTFTSDQIKDGQYDFDGNCNKFSTIKVKFTPDLSGEVDRSFVNQGKTGYFENFDFEIWNNGSSNIQYKWYIVEKNQTSTRPTNTIDGNIYKQYDTLRYDDDNVFVYYTKDWVYTNENEIENKNGSWVNPNKFHSPDEEPKLRYKGTDWHYLEAGGYKHQPVYYSQVNLKQGVEYTVYVLAMECPYDNASTIFGSADPDSKSLASMSYDIVYQSDFSMLYYDDVKYNPDDDRLGILPFNGYEGLADETVYDYSFDAEKDSSGNINYSGFTFDKSKIPDRDGNTPSSVDGGTEIISNTSGVFSFFSVIFGVFPPEVNKILTISLWVGFALFLIRRLT